MDHSGEGRKLCILHELCRWRDSRQLMRVRDQQLAHAHARSGEPAKISDYLGKSDNFDQAIADFSSAYADQSERDHEVLMNAARAGKLEVFVEGESQCRILKIECHLDEISPP